MARDQDKTKAQLIDELAELRRRVAELETPETERQRVEQASLEQVRALQESEERYRHIFEQSPIGIGISSQDGKVIACNEAMEAITGYSLEELKKINLADTYENAEDREALLKALSQSSGAVDFPVRLRHKDGTPYDALLNISQINLGGEVFFQTICQDVSERKRMEEQIFVANERLQYLLSSTSAVIYTARPSGDYGATFIAENVAQMTGYEPRKFLEESSFWINHVHPDDTERVLSESPAILEHGRYIYEYRFRRKDGAYIWVRDEMELVRDKAGEPLEIVGYWIDITEHKQAEDALRQRNRELSLLNRAGQAFGSTLDLDRVLAAVLEEVRSLLDVTACSVWLTDPRTDELVCRQVTGPQSETVRGWRLAPGEGFAGWVARSGEGLIVPDARADGRHYEGVDEKTGLTLRSILTVPLPAKRGVIGVLQVVDTTVDRFTASDLELIESLAMPAAIAIENAGLYEQARRDAETKSVLLQEINHRVKNNLSAIIGLLYAELRRPGMADLPAYQSTMKSVINRVLGLSTVHDLLSASEWTPLLLDQLATEVVRSCLLTLPRGECASIDVTPSQVRVTSDQAHNLAPVINELATNAIKHALGERSTMRIDVRIALEGDTILIEFRDDGPGYPENVLRLERYGVGFDLVQNIVRKSLQGTLSLRNDHGAVAEIRFETGI